MNQRISLFVLFFAFLHPLYSGSLPGSMERIETTLNQRTSFISNQGQWDEEVRYFTQNGNMNAWFTGRGVVFDFFRMTADNGQRSLRIPGEKPGERETVRRMGHVLMMTFVTSSESQPVFRTQQPQTTRYNYFLGNDPTNWAQNVPLFDEIILEGVFGKDAGIDVRYYYEPEGLRYDFIVHPGARADDIAFIIEGADEVLVKDDDELIIMTSLGEIRHKGLLAYQEINGEKREVPGSFHLNERGEVGFHVHLEDATRPLIIDPLIYSTFLGGNITDQAYCLALDSQGNVYVAGQTNSPIFPTTPGAYDETFNNKRDIFVSVLSPDLSELLYSSFLGAEDEEIVFGLALDENDIVYITGQTGSEFFPTTPGAFDTVHNGSGDAFVSALSPDLGQLLYSTLLGGTSSDVGYDIAVHPDGNIYIVGYSGSINYPSTAGVFQPSNSGIGSVIVSVLNPDLSQLVYSTFLGGSPMWESGRSIAFDPDGNVYITGETWSNNFPVTPGAYNETHNGGSWDGFVSILSHDLSQLLYSTFIGGSHEDYGLSITLDTENNVYVSGMTRSADFPATPGAYSTSFSAYRDAFICIFNPDLSDLLYATYIGGNTWDYANDIALASNGYVYIAGFTSSSNYPVTPGAFNETFSGTRQVIISVFTPDLSELAYSTFLGGSSFEEATKILFDETGDIYLTGWTFSADFPTTEGAYNETHNGGYDVFVSVFQGGFLSSFNLALLANPEEGGTVSGDGVYVEGQEVTITAIPEEGWTFLHWTGDVEYVDDPDAAETLVSMPADDVTLTANFELMYYVLTLEANPPGGGSVVGGGEYHKDAEVTVTAEPAEGWDFLDWTDSEGAVISEEPGFLFTMPPGDVTLIATFQFPEQVTDIPGVNLMVYPNPARQLLTVSSNELIEQIRMVNLSGQIVKYMTVDALQAEVNIQNLREGFYIMQVYTAKGLVMKTVQRINN